MKRLLSAVWLVVVPGLLHAADEDAATKECAKFAGTWRFASVEAEGKRLPKKHFKDSRLVIEGRHFTLQEGDLTYQNPKGGQWKTGSVRRPTDSFHEAGSSGMLGPAFETLGRGFFR
jgi:hypothetical protein